MPAVMNSAVAWVATSAVCQTPGGLIAYSPARSVTFRVPSGSSWSSVISPAVQITTSSPAGCISQLVQLSLKLYSQGTEEFLNVLNAQRSLLFAEGALAESDRTVVTNLIALYKALGGGWETPVAVQVQAPTTQPEVGPKL